jgi:hypothetical protein
MCDVSGVSLDKQECVLISLIHTQPKLMGMPVVGIYDEVSGVLTLNNDSDLNLSYKCLIESVSLFQDMKEYLVTDHEKLFKYPFENKSFEALLIHKEVFDSISKIDGNSSYSYSTSVINDIDEAIKNTLKLEQSTVLLNEMALEICSNNEELSIDDFNVCKSKYTKETAAAIKSFSKETSTRDEYLNIFDKCREDGLKNQITLSFQPDLKLLNAMLVLSSMPSKEIIDNLSSMWNFRIAYKAINPNPRPNTKDAPYHQPTSTDAHIEYYEHLLAGLKRIKEE